MKSLDNLADKIEDWLKPIPHLPTSWRKWLAKNFWWITLICVIFSGIGLFLTISIIATAIMVTAGIGISGYGAYTPIAHSWAWICVSMLAAFFLFLIVVALAVAVSYLKNMNKKGWTILFIVFLLSSASSIINFFTGFRLSTVLFDLIGVALNIFICAYIVFELRPYFNHRTAKVVSSKKK